MVTTVVQSKPRARTRVWVMAALLLAVVAALVIRAGVEARAQDRIVDRYYCTMSNVGPLDRAPQTGERCIDVIEEGY